MREGLEEVQRIVLKSDAWTESAHLVLSFPKGSYPLRFLHKLKAMAWPTSAKAEKAETQVSLGFSRRGLESAQVPQPVLALFALKSPAFAAGAALRASQHLGAGGRDAPSSWDKAFGFETLDAVLSVHAKGVGVAAELKDQVIQVAAKHGLGVAELPPGLRLPPPPGLAESEQTPSSRTKPASQWVHFGYRDGLARIGIEGLTHQRYLDELRPSSIHPVGEFLLGYPQHSGANPWLAGPDKGVWPRKLRDFFARGSFGVVQQIEQHVGEFESFVNDKAKLLDITPDELKAKLCGRYPNGLPLAADKSAQPETDFDYVNDRKGYACPFGSHIRRMNPRGDALAHAGRVRPLLRRGMPYGEPWAPDCGDTVERGLIGHFFCASIEDQFEHLIGQWANMVPLGSRDIGRAKDPLIGGHEPGDGDFVIERPDQQAPLRVKGLLPFTRTRGTAYLFYPSLATLQGIAEGSDWGLTEQDDE